MDKKFIVFSVLAIVAQISICSASKNSINFTEEYHNTLDALAIDRLTGKNYTFVGLSNIFQILINLTEEASRNQTCTQYENLTDAFSFGFEQLRNMVGVFIDSSSTFGGESCTLNATTRLEMRRTLDAKVVGSIINATELARKGNYPANLLEFEKYAEASRKGFQYFVATMFTFIRSCSKNTRSNVESLVAEVAARYYENSLYRVNATFESIKIYAQLVSGNIPSENYRSAGYLIDIYRFNTITKVSRNVDLTLTLYEAIYIDNYCGGTNILKILYDLRYSHDDVINGFSSGVQLIGSAIRSSLSNLTSDPSIRGQAVRAFQNAGNSYLGAVSRSQPGSYTNVTVAAAVFPDLIQACVGRYLIALSFINNRTLSSSQIISAINATENIQLRSTLIENAVYFSVIHYNASNAAHIRPEISTAESKALNSIQSMVNSIFNGIRLAANVRSANKTTSEDQFAYYQLSIVTAIVSVVRFSDALSHGNLLQILANQGLA